MPEVEKLGSAEDQQSPARFQETRWSLVALASEQGGAESRRALNELCQIYWFPLYAYLRRSGTPKEAAEDLTQDFFLWLIERDRLRLADQRAGKLRSFLLTCLKHFAANAHRKAVAERRGGKAAHVSVDGDWAEERLLAEPGDPSLPELLFDWSWAHCLFENALAAVRRAFEAKGFGDRFAALRPFLSGSPPGGYGAAAAALGISEGAAKGAVHRMREAFREELRREVRATLAHPTPADIDAELNHLFGVLGAASL
ncbi:MAG: hypothetical protein R3F11_16645 [Verrucomicrobiales bacterium]